MKANQWLFWFCLVLTITIACFLFCFNALVVKVPWNFITVGLFTIFNSYFVSGICLWQPVETVLIAAVMTLGMFLGLTLLSFCTKYDLNYCSGLISSLTMILFFLIILIWVFQSDVVLVCACAGVLVIMSIFIIYDT